MSASDGWTGRERILVLALVCLALAGLVYRSQAMLDNAHPFIVRINDVGHADAIDYRNFRWG